MEHEKTLYERNYAQREKVAANHYIVGNIRKEREKR